MARDGSNPRNLEEVLRLAVENTSQDDSSRSASDLPAQDREWLSEAIAAGVGSQAGPSPSARVKEIVVGVNNGYLKPTAEGINAPNAGDGSDAAASLLTEEQAVELLEEAVEWAEDIDVANDLIRMGGVAFLEVLLQREEAELRRCGAELTGATCQNNEKAQEACCSQLLPVLLQRVDTDSANTVRVKAQYAVSCIVRGCSSAQEVFLKNDGLSILLRAMNSDVYNLKVKATFLLIGLCNDSNSIQETLTKMGMVEGLASLLSGGGSRESPSEESGGFREHAASALLALLTDCVPAQKEAAAPRLGLAAILRQRQSQLAPEAEEERDAVRQCFEIVTAAETRATDEGAVSSSDAVDR